MQSEYFDVLINNFSKQAVLTGKKFKSGKSFEDAKERIKEDDFIRPFSSYFDEFSVQELEYLTSVFEMI